MLKIKDNLDLKELEKYGFVRNKYYQNNYSNIMCYGRRGQCFELIIGIGRIILGYSEGADGDGEEGIVSDVLYDLIKDGLVEKVDE